VRHFLINVIENTVVFMFFITVIILVLLQNFLRA